MIRILLLSSLLFQSISWAQSFNDIFVPRHVVPFELSLKTATSFADEWAAWWKTYRQLLRSFDMAALQEHINSCRFSIERRNRENIYTVPGIVQAPGLGKDGVHNPYYVVPSPVVQASTPVPPTPPHPVLVQAPPVQQSYVVTVKFSDGHENIFSSTKNYQAGLLVTVDGDRGYDVGVVVTSRMAKSKEGSIGKIRHLALMIDAAAFEKNPQLEAECLAYLGELKRKNKFACLNHMTFTACSRQVDGKKITFFYNSPERVEFRELAAALFNKYHCRIWFSKN